MRKRRMPPRREALRREQEALKLLALGVEHATIAHAIGVDARTVRRYKRKAMAYLAMRGIAS
jgi:DNA-binding NarL/FixJ family response regulator